MLWFTGLPLADAMSTYDETIISQKIFFSTHDFLAEFLLIIIRSQAPTRGIKKTLLFELKKV